MEKQYIPLLHPWSLTYQQKRGAPAKFGDNLPYNCWNTASSYFKPHAPLLHPWMVYSHFDFMAQHIHPIPGGMQEIKSLSIILSKISATGFCMQINGERIFPLATPLMIGLSAKNWCCTIRAQGDATCQVWWQSALWLLRYSYFLFYTPWPLATPLNDILAFDFMTQLIHPIPGCMQNIKSLSIILSEI